MGAIELLFDTNIHTTCFLLIHFTCTNIICTNTTIYTSRIHRIHQYIHYPVMMEKLSMQMDVMLSAASFNV